MENLLTNACAYGGSAAMQLTLEKNVLVVTVSDRGPGTGDSGRTDGEGVRALLPGGGIEKPRFGRHGPGSSDCEEHGAVERRDADAREPTRGRAHGDAAPAVVCRGLKRKIAIRRSICDLPDCDLRPRDPNNCPASSPPPLTGTTQSSVLSEDHLIGPSFALRRDLGYTDALLG